ncbi:MAG: hypothetical protein AB8H86_02585 [Polyangiales bacterium]
MKMKLLILIVGLGGGAALMHFFEKPARQAVGLLGREVEASVLEERRDEDGRLVLMLESEGESMLATFRERADDVASLVHVGDVVTFRAPIDGVFSDDVPLLSVRRSEASEDEGSAEESTEPVEESEAEQAEAAEAEELQDAEPTENPAAEVEEGEEGEEGEEDAPQPVADAANPESEGAEPPQSAES